MPSKPMIESWIPGAVEQFRRVFPLPLTNIYYAVTTETKIEETVKYWTEHVENGGTYKSDSEWAGMTFPGKKGIAIIMRQKMIRGIRDFRHYFWHELGHAYAFCHESKTEYHKHGGLPYLVWAEFIADYFAFIVNRATGNPVGLAPMIQLKKIESGDLSAIGHFCCEALLSKCPDQTPEDLKKLVELFREKVKNDRFWEIDENWIETIRGTLKI